MLVESRAAVRWELQPTPAVWTDRQGLGFFFFFLAGKVSVLICDEWGWKDHRRGECLEVWGAAGLDGAHTAPRADG